METNTKGDREGQDLLISYMALRQAIGFTAIFFPASLWLGNFLIFQVTELKPSISAYHWSEMRDVFAGLLTAIAALLASYQGYKKDHRASWIAAAFLMGVVLIPCDNDHENTLRGSVHLLCALVFFIALIYIAAHLFTKSNTRVEGQKKKRNAVYRGCAWIMSTSVFLLVLLAVLNHFGYTECLSQWKPVFWLETIAVMTFGVAWVVKGEFILKDLAKTGYGTSNGN